MSTKALGGDARERTRGMGESDGLGAGLDRADAAARRDLAAADRDAEANARDSVAVAADFDEEPLSPSNGEQRQVRSARDRESAASDRVEAGLDRRQAAADRELSRDAVGDVVCDELTGAMRPRVGLAALQREMDRSGRTGEPLVVAFIDVVGGESSGAAPGGPPGSQALQDVGRSLIEDVRDYDLVARMGDTGFVCAQAGQSIARATARYGDVALRLAARPGGATMTVGLLSPNSGESLEALVDRADLTLSGTA
jgi:GGDEF domain-containing protein